jgi:primosomal protein N'
MRAINLCRRCPAFNTLTTTRVTPRFCTIKQFHSSPLTAKKKDVETEHQAAPPPKKRGRPKKINPEDTLPETTAKIIETEVAATTVKVAKPRKKAPQISDITRLIPPTAVNPGPIRSLRPYQEECVEACLTAIAEGRRRLGISLATGAGKTVIFTNLIGKVQLEDTKRYQTLILVHRRELVEQAARHCVEVYPDKVQWPFIQEC